MLKSSVCCSPIASKMHRERRERGDSCSEIEPENRRAGMRSKALYRTESWDDLEQFYAKQNKLRRAHPASSSVKSRRRRCRKVISGTGSRFVPRQDGQRPIARCVPSKVLALDARNLQAAEALIPAVRDGERSEKARGRAEIQLSHTGDVDVRVERIRHWRSSSRTRSKTRSRPTTGTSRRSVRTGN